MTYEDEDESFGFYDGECQVCDLFGRVDDILLCEECAGKLDRDLIRMRDWDYSITAFGVLDSKLEELRGHIVAQYGEELELIAPKEKKKRKTTNTRKNGAVKSNNLSLQLNFAPQQAKAAELFVIKLLSKRLYLRKINTIKY